MAEVSCIARYLVFAEAVFGSFEEESNAIVSIDMYSAAFLPELSGENFIGVLFGFFYALPKMDPRIQFV